MNKSVKIFTAVCISAVIFSSCKKKEEVHGNVAEQENNTREITATISLGFSTNLEDPRGKASVLFKEDVEKNSNGRIKIDIRRRDKRQSRYDRFERGKFCGLCNETRNFRNAVFVLDF